MDQGLWSKNFIILSLLNFINRFQYFLSILVFSAYAVVFYGATISVAGLTVSMFVIGSLFGRLFVNELIKKYGMKKILLYNLIGAILCSAFYFIEINLLLVLIFRLFHGMTIGMASTTIGTVCLKIIPDSKKGEGLGYFSLSAVIGTAIGPLIGIHLLALDNGYYILFSLILVLNSASALVASQLSLKEEQQVQMLVKRTRYVLNNFIEIKALPISLFAMVIGLCFSGVTSYVTLYSQEIDLVKEMAFFFLIHAIGVICTRPITGKLMDMRGVNIVIYPCLFLFSIGMLIYSQVSTLWLVILAGLMIGVGFGNFNLASQIISIKNLAKDRLGVATATYFIFLDIGSGIGPYLLGNVAELIGFRKMYVLLAVISLISIAIYYVVQVQKNVEKQSSFTVRVESKPLENNQPR